MTSSPPSSPTKYFQDAFDSRAMLASASARCRAPDIKSSRERGVWRTPLGTSTGMISKSLPEPRKGPMTESASRTASTFGLRALPTAMRIFSISESFGTGTLACCVKRRNRAWAPALLALRPQVNIVVHDFHLRFRFLQLGESEFLV